MSNIHGLFSNKDKNSSQGDGNNSGDDSDSDQRRQGFFVGGSDRSGQEVLGPANSDFASHFFDQINRSGAQMISDEEAESRAKARTQASSQDSSSAAAASSGSSSASRYQGGTFRLGGHGLASESVVNADVEMNVRGANARASVGRNRRETGDGNGTGDSVDSTIHLHVNLWNNGFSIDDGPLRNFENEQNRAFLAAVAMRRNPPELLQLYPNRNIEIHLERKLTQYIPPKPKPFSGTGHRLGSVVPSVVGVDGESVSDGAGTTSAGSASAPDIINLDDDEFPPFVTDSAESARLLKEAQDAVGLVQDQPIGRVQIRLPSPQASQPGSEVLPQQQHQPDTLVAQFNPNRHTIADLRSFIVVAQPALAFRPFELLSGRPPRSIQDESFTLKQADLVGAVVIVRFVDGQ